MLQSSQKENRIHFSGHKRHSVVSSVPLGESLCDWRKKWFSGLALIEFSLMSPSSFSVCLCVRSSSTASCPLVLISADPCWNCSFIKMNAWASSGRKTPDCKRSIIHIQLRSQVNKAEQEYVVRFTGSRCSQLPSAAVYLPRVQKSHCRLSVSMATSCDLSPESLSPLCSSLAPLTFDCGHFYSHRHIQVRWTNY